MEKYLIVRQSADGHMEYTQDTSNTAQGAEQLAKDWLKLSLPGAKCHLFVGIGTVHEERQFVKTGAK